MQQLEKYAEALALDYNLLLKKSQLENIETCLIRTTKQIEIIFLIKFSISLPKIFFMQTKSTNVEVLLFIHFLTPSRNSRVMPELHLPTNFESMFDDKECLRIPPLFENQTLVDYVFEVKQHITDKVNFNYFY